MNYYVFYSDDYGDNGGIGLESFTTKKEAIDFINYLLKTAREPDYKLIEGLELKLVPVTVVKEFAIE